MDFLYAHAFREQVAALTNETRRCAARDGQHCAARVRAQGRLFQRERAWSNIQTQRTGDLLHLFQKPL